MNAALKKFRSQYLEVLETDKAFREAFYCFRWIMRASDEEIEVSDALNQLAGKRKREEDEANTDLEASPSTKNALPKTYPELFQHCSGTPSIPGELKVHDYSVRQKLTRESLQTVRDRLCSLTIKNKEIKDSIQSLRKTVIDDLYGHMKIRQIAIGQLGRHDLDEDMQQLCTKALWSRKEDLFSKQKELTTLEELLGGHKAVLEFSDSAFEELKQNIRILETALTDEQCTAICTYEFPRMTALARLTGGLTVLDSPPFTEPDELAELRRRPDAFPQFSRLPTEVRCMIWQEALPDARIITHNSKHNRDLALIAVNKEARCVMMSKLTRLLSPTFDTDKTDTRIVHVNVEVDTIIRDLANPGGPDPFDLDISSFNSVCYRLFIGLVKVKHLALAFDLVHNNGGQLFGPLQACCPDLETITLFPTSMIEGGPLKMPKQPTHQKLKFIEMDSNVIDLVYYRLSLVRDRHIKRKAHRGISILLTLYDHSKQYHTVFPQYVKQYGQKWNPSIRVALMMKWNDKCKAWQTRTLDGDKYSRGYTGDDGRGYRGFVESGMMCGEDGELLSRYDGITRMFGDLEI